MIPLLIAVLCVSAAAAAPAAPAPAPVPVQVHSSTSIAAVSASAAYALGASTYTVETLYTGDKTRDPFMPPSMGGVKRPAGSAVDIHALKLVGVMKDPAADYAVFTTDFGTTLILRGGRLYDDRSRIVPGITGRIKTKQKWVELMTTDTKDVQPFRLGEASADDPSQNP
jgi:hypothetical protein